MKKKLNEAAIANELHESSMFFRSPGAVQKDEQPSPPLPIPAPTDEAIRSSPPLSPHPEAAPPRYHDTVIPQHHDTIIETTRRAAKQVGKEAATHRFTLDEKRALRSIERDYEEKEVRTSENEITRIAINYIIADYRAHQSESILARVLKLLHS
jgi:hypothetical protein